VTLAACGSTSNKRQDENEPKGRYPVEVMVAEFPEQQKLAKTSEILIKVRNAGEKTIPNIGVSLKGLQYRRDDPDLADPDRPIFVLNSKPKNIGGFPEAKDTSPLGCDTAYVDTWSCGPLKPGRIRTFRWQVTAVEARPFDLRYTVAAGLDGKAIAVDADKGGRPKGSFTGTVSDKPPRTRVAEDGSTVTGGTR
jgi:hypothetical protein